MSFLCCPLLHEATNGFACLGACASIGRMTPKRDRRGSAPASFGHDWPAAGFVDGCAGRRRKCQCSGNRSLGRLMVGDGCRIRVASIVMLVIRRWPGCCSAADSSRFGCASVVPRLRLRHAPRECDTPRRGISCVRIRDEYSNHSVREID